MKQQDRLDAAAMLDRLIQAVETHDLAADGAVGAGLVKRMQGAHEALVHRPGPGTAPDPV